MSDTLKPGTFGEGGNWETSSAPKNRMRKASWKMSVALPCQAHFQGLSILSLLGSRIFSSGKPGYRLYVERRSPPTGLICGRGSNNGRE